MWLRIKAFLTAVVLFITGAFPGIFGGSNVRIDEERLILPETWAAVDGLGRTLPVGGEVRTENKRKFVAMFYWTWHTDFAKSLSAKNVTEILSKYPEIAYDFDAPQWDPEPTYQDGRPYFWNEPLWGYYRDTDEYVLRKNAELLADAGVDVIVFDCTNGTATWDESCLKLFEVFEAAKADGVCVPKIAYMLPFKASEDTTWSLRHLYEMIYSKDKCRDLWFMWDGKPLIMAHKDALDTKDPTDQKIAQFFTFRKNDPSYFSQSTAYSKKTWGWCSDYPQAGYGRAWSGRVEEMCVSVAQNAADGKLVAQNAQANVQGRSFTHGDYAYAYTYAGKTVHVDKTIDDSDLYGLNFQQQWDYALHVDPDLIFVDGWNEWIAGRWKEWCGTENAFPDQFSDEHSRDIEPAAGRMADHYYYQLVANIRRFKGIGKSTIENDGVKTYYHYTNSTPKRDCDGWKDLHYASDTMRNDFVRADVRDDGETVYFTIETKAAVTPSTDSAWMRVFVDTDPSGVSPNWEGFEYVIGREGTTANTMRVERSVGGWDFTQTGTASYTVTGNKLELAVPATALGIRGSLRFNFKLSDNMQQDGDILDFYKNGDVAPGGRFTFVY